MRTIHLKELIGKTIEPAILVVDEKLNIQYQSTNTAHYLKLPKTLTTLKQLETLNKVAFTSIAKTAIHSIKSIEDIKISENLTLKNKNYSISLKIQKLETKPLKDVLFSICISKYFPSKIASLKNHLQNGENEKFKNVEFLESKLNGALTELNLLKKENEHLKSVSEATSKNLEHIKTEYDISLNEQYELNFFMTEMLKNANVATVFLNLELQIIKYTPLLSKLFDVENRDIGRKITDFNHIFTSNNWVELLKNAKNSDSKIELELTTKNDQYYLMIINPAKFSHITTNVLSVSFVNISSQVKAKQDKIASEEKFKTLFESAIDGMAIIDLDKDAIVASNKKMPQLLGITKKTYLNTNPINFFPEFQSDGTKSKDLLEKMHQTLRQKGQVTRIVEHKHQTKGTFYARFSEYIIPHPKQNYAAVVLQNVDKEIRTIEALKKSKIELNGAKDRYKSLFENSMYGVGVFDLAKQKVVEINDSLVKMTGFSKSEYIARAPFGIFTEFLEDGRPTKELYIEMVSHLVNGGNKIFGHFIQLHKNKAPFHVKIFAHKLPKPNQHLAVCVTKNIDAQKKAEAKSALSFALLKASESRYKAFFNKSLDGHIILNLEDMKPVEVNKRMLQMMGISKTEYFNAQALDFFDAESNSFSVAQVFSDFHDCIEKNRPFEKEVYAKSKKRKPFLVRLLITQLPTHNQHLVYAVVKDIDKERKAELESAKHLKALAASESMFRTFFENGQHGFAIGQLLPSPKPIDVNLKMCELLGLTKKEFLSSGPLQFLSPTQSSGKSSGKVLQEILQSIAEKGRFTGNIEYLHKKIGSFYTEVNMVRLKAPHQDKVFTQIVDKNKEVKALQQVAKSEALFKSIFANSLDGIVIYDMDTLEAIDCNKRVLQMTNCSRNEFTKSQAKDFLPEKQPNGEDSLSTFKQYLKSVTKNKSVNKEWLFKRYNSNELVYALISIVKLPAPFKKLAVISIADITETKLAENAIFEKNKIIEIANQKLKISYKKFKDTFDNSANFIGRISLKGILIEHNQTIYNKLNDKTVPTTNILVWKFPWFKNHKDTQRQLKQDFESAKIGQNTKSQTAYTISPNFAGILEYTFKPLKNEKGEITSILAEGYDVTEQVNALKKLAFNEQKFRAIFNNSSSFIGIFNTKGIILDLNKSVTKNLGDEKAPTLGISIWNFPWFLKHKNAQLALKKGVKQAAKGGKAEEIINYTIHNSIAGTMQFSITPIINDAGKVEWLLGEGKDISTIINAQNELSYNEQKFRSIFNNSSNLIGLYDTDGYIEELNLPLLKEIEESQFPGAFPKVKIWDNPWIAAFKESKQVFKTGFKKVLKGEIDRGIIQYSPIANYTGIFEYTLSPIFDKNNKVIKVLGEGKDITEQLNAQKEIEASEKRFRALFYNAKNRIVRLSPNGKIIAHNKIHKGRKSYASTKKYIGKYLWQLIERNNITKASCKQIKLAVKKAANGAFVSDTLLGLDAKNQKIFLRYSLKPVFDANGKVEWILGESYNITEIINTQQKLALKEQKFRAIFNNSSNFIGLYNLDGTIEELNKPILEKIPENKRTKINSTLKLWELPLSNQFKKAIKRVFSACLKKVLKGEVYKGTAHYSLDVNESIFLEFIFSPVFDEKNKVIKILGESRDITEQINSRKQIETSEKRFKALFFNAENIVVRLSPEGRVIAHNKIVKSKGNYELLKEYIGKYLWEFSGVFGNKKAQEQLKKDIKKAANGKLAYGSIFSKDNRYQQIQLTYSFKPIFGTNNTVEWILGEARDITDFIKAQQKFKAIFYNSENYIARLDAKGNVLEHSRVHKDKPRYEVVKQYIGKPLWEFSGIVEHPKSIANLKKDIKICASGQFVSNQIAMRVYKTNHSKNNPQFKSGLVVYTLTPVFDKKNAVDWILAEAKDITELDEAKNKLSLSLNKYQKLFENNLVGIITLDENLKLVECNKAYEKITGYSLNETKALNYYDFIDKKEIEAAKINEQKIKTNNIKSLQFKRTFTKKNGEIIFVNLYLKPIYDNKKFTSAVVTIADITELENKRAALKQSEELYKAVFDGVNDGLYVYNEKKNKIITFNERLLKIAGSKSKKQFLARADEQFIPYLKGKNAQKTNWIKKISTHLKSHKIAKFDFTLVKPKGTSLDLSTSTIKLNDALSLTVISDITETKKAKKALLESETKYRSLFENNVTGIALSNKFGQILQVNNALCNIFGYSEKEMLKLKHQDLSTQGEDDQSYTNFKAMVDGKAKKFSTTKQFIKKNGDAFYAIIFVSGIYDKKNNFKYNIASISDISELKNLENELKVKQLELADKVVELEKYIESNLELENFAFIASHDLKSPTRTIINYSNLLIEKAEKKLDPVELQFLKFIIEGSNRLQNTISDLLNFSLANNNTLNIKKANLNTLLKNIIKDLNSTIVETNATIKIEGLPAYNWVDKGLYKALFLNLIGNALKFHSKRKKPLVKITCKKIDTSYLFSVEDNGIGIAKKSQQKIFGIFQRLHVYSEFEGTGIGLALCKKVVEKHKGKIWVKSTKGKGSIFYFTLPNNLKQLNEKI